jgi:YfiH family protein
MMTAHDCIGEFLVVRAPFDSTAAVSEGSFVAFTTLTQRIDGSGASFKMEAEERARRELEAALSPLTFSWLTLEHGSRVVEIPFTPGSTGVGDAIAADAAVVSALGSAVAFTTADCLPVILASKSSGRIAGIHAGWRGIARGVLEESCLCFTALCGERMPKDAEAWVGPAIQAKDYEIDDDTRRQLLESPFVRADHFFPTQPRHFLADLPAMARAKLEAAGIAAERINVHAKSTFSDSRYHSARRDEKRSGRMATVVGMLPKRQ